MRIKVLLMALMCMLFNACMMEAGYDPSDKYDDKDVMYKTGYIEDGICDDYYVYIEMPKCTDKLEGYVVSDDPGRFTSAAVYACIDGFWTYRRQESTSKLENVPYYTEDLSPNKKCNFGYSSNSRPGSSSSAQIDDGSDGYITDARDGQTYAAVTIAGSVWMAENLRFDPSELTEDLFIAAALYDPSCDGGVCWYYSKPLDELCPAGYHVPSEDEWYRLFRWAGDADVLKSKEFTEPSFAPGKDTYGFSAKPYGFGALIDEGSDDEYLSLEGFDNVAVYWTSERKTVASLNSGSNIPEFGMTVTYVDNDGNTTTRVVLDTDYFPIRCVRAK